MKLSLVMLHEKSNNLLLGGDNSNILLTNSHSLKQKTYTNLNCGNILSACITKNYCIFSGPSSFVIMNLSKNKKFWNPKKIKTYSPFFDLKYFNVKTGSNHVFGILNTSSKKEKTSVLLGLSKCSNIIKINFEEE